MATKLSKMTLDVYSFVAIDSILAPSGENVFWIRFRLLVSTLYTSRRCNEMVLTDRRCFLRGDAFTRPRCIYNSLLNGNYHATALKIE